MNAPEPLELSPRGAAMYNRGYADAFTSIRGQLAHHASGETDPCADRGVDWPCDVADALGFAADGSDR